MRFRGEGLVEVQSPKQEDRTRKKDKPGKGMTMFVSCKIKMCQRKGREVEKGSTSLKIYAFIYSKEREKRNR